MDTDTLIRLLVALWYELISRDHHKDRDCHFRIAQHWKYDGEMEWELEHYGYILHDREDINTFPSQEAAKEALLTLLIKATSNELETSCELTAPYRSRPIDTLRTIHNRLGQLTMNLKNGRQITGLLKTLAITIETLTNPAASGQPHAPTTRVP